MPNDEPFWFRAAKLAIWAAAILLFFRFLGYLVGGNFRDFWLIIATASTMFITFFATLLKRLRLPGDAECVSSITNGGTNSQTLNPLMTKDPIAMAKNENQSFTFTAPVTINTATNHNAPGGIISNAPVTVNQYYDKQKPAAPIIDAEIIEAAPVVPEAETASLDELRVYAETLMGRAIAENTIRNVLERAAIESCDEEKRGRAWAKLYPKTQAEKVLADYVTTNKRK